MGSCLIRRRKTGHADSDIITISPAQFIKETKDNFYASYRIGKMLGKGLVKYVISTLGAFGAVYICAHNDTSKLRAVKVLDKRTVDPSSLKMYMNEIAVMKQLDHPNIVRLYEVYEDSKRCYLVTELCTGGDLFDKFIKEGACTEKNAAIVMRQILAAVAYCHSKKVVHRDIKPQNLLFASTEKGARIKLIDFGTSQFFNSSSKMNAKVGTPYYISPEVLKRSYDAKCDVWSCGVILYILLCGYPPFDGKDNIEILSKISKGEYKMHGEAWEDVSKQARDLVKKMLIFDPLKRCTAVEALNHEWIQKYSQEESKQKTLAILGEMRSFGARHKLQQAGLTYIVSQLATKKEKKELETMFLSLDKSGTGKLSPEDLVRGFKEVYGEGFPAEEEVLAIMDKIDMDKNGYIDYTEFVVATVNKATLLSRERLETAFKMFDKDNSGYISVDEIKSILGGNASISEKEWKEIVDEVDTNGDGEISLEEFIDLMQKVLDPF